MPASMSLSSTTADETAAPRLRMEGVRKRFGATLALDGVDLSVDAGHVLALVGENGAGKSTLMKVLSGAHAPDEGKIWLDGQPYQPRDPLDARRHGVAMIYQELSLAKDLTVMENILLGMEPVLGPFVRWGEMKRRAAGAMAQLGRSDIRPNIVLGKLSLAEQQLVEIGRALCVGCRVLVLDEPTSSLTQSDIRHLFHMVRQLKSRGLAIIYISHFLEEVREISDRFIVLRDGRSVGGGITADVPTSQIISMMVGRSVDDLYPRSPRTAGEQILEIKNLAGELKPIDASIQLHRGEVVGIAGLIGAGRTEMLRAVFGLDPIKSGEVKLSTYVGPASPARRWAEGMGLLSEDRKDEGLAVHLSIADNVTMTRMGRFVNPRALAEESRQWIAKLGIRCRSPRQEVNDLSGGNQQKVAVARLLRHDVDVFLLDEPTRGIDVGSKSQIYRLIDDLARRGKAVLMVSSYLPELLGVCDRIAVMCKGRLVRSVPAGQTNEHQIMLEATGALETV
jgi:ribose transport system ATP-binding protein